MSKLKSVAVVLAFLALAGLAVWQEVRARRLMLEGAALRKLNDQAAQDAQERERLTVQLQSANERAQAASSEMTRLRGQAARLRQIEQENARLKSERERLARQAQSSSTDAAEPAVEPPSEGEVQRAKGFFGRDLGLVLIIAADANNGVVPADLSGPLFDVLAAFSAGSKHHFKASQFELMFSGSLHLKEGEQGILAREREPVQRADGQWVRVYVMADGSSQHISAATRDGFAAKERELAPAMFRQ